MNPTSSSIWGLNQQACITWDSDTVLEYETIGSIFVEYGPNFSLFKLILSDNDSSSGQFEWRVNQIYPGTVRVKLSLRSGQTFYSDEFTVSPVSSRDAGCEWMRYCF